MLVVVYDLLMVLIVNMQFKKSFILITLEYRIIRELDWLARMWGWGFTPPQYFQIRKKVSQKSAMLRES